MDTTNQNKSSDELIRARIDSDLKDRFDKWCSSKKVSSSQILRWVIEMHLEDPNKLWTWLSEKESLTGDDDVRD